VRDKRETTDTGVPTRASRVTNFANLDWLFKEWANICVKGLSDLKELSPMPEDIKPKQKLK
jgi:hypothetical protein